MAGGEDDDDEDDAGDAGDLVGDVLGRHRMLLYKKHDVR